MTLEQPVPARVAEDLNFADAHVLVERLRTREVSAIEVMRSFLAQIERLNPLVNAIPTVVPEEDLLEAARASDRAIARGDALGALHGLPVAIKDLTLTHGIRTTFGSRIYRDFVPATDDLYVQRFKQAGAIVIGKTNTPEFGAGSQTFNALFGATRNPYDLAKTCGGSSGGAAAALACGMLPLADGTDLGGSLRNPASFCNVVGFRPSPGRVPRLGAHASDTLGVHGPMARTVRDLALLLSVMAGPDPRDPVSIDEPASVFLGGLERSFQGVRIAWSQTLGRYPVEPIVTTICNGARRVFGDLGCDLADREPDFSGVDEIFQTLRAAGYALAHRVDLERHRNLLKDTVVWNIEQGLRLTKIEVTRAEAALAAFRRRIAGFFSEYDFLILPVAQVAPFSVDVEWVREIDGIPMQTYIDWMASCYAISCAGLPAISIPCGFTPDGLPIGLQIVGRYRRDMEVLQLARAFERATQFARRRPAIATGEERT
jgi:amidase